MKLFHIITSALCSWTLVLAQSDLQDYQQQTNRNRQILEPIYFSDNRPGSPNFQGVDSYLPVASKNNGQFTTPGNNERRPSIQQRTTDLQGPPFDKNQVYYDNGSSNSNIDLEQKLGNNKGEQINGPFKNISLAITNFGLNLLTNIDQGAGNVVVSPFSITMLLALLQQGAMGLTQQQISTALKLSPYNARELFRQLNESFNKKRNSRNILRVANNVYVADAFELNPAFKSVAIRNFGSEVTPIRFNRPSEAVRKINHWVATKTNDKIMELLPPSAVSGNSQLVLINAVYFKGLWQMKFKPDSTLPLEFYLGNGAKKAIPFMRMRQTFRAGVDEMNNAQVIILPFENEQYSLMVVLPSEATSLDSVVSSLTDAQLASYHAFTKKEVELEIPKFTARADTDLNLVLRKMNITDIFSQQADLSNLGKYRTSSPQVTSAFHTAMLSINEDGATAAAATAFAVVALSFDDLTFKFKVDRPFLAVVWDNQSGLPLFMAKIHDPME